MVLRKDSIHRTFGRVHGIEIGSKTSVQFCFYDKKHEMKEKNEPLKKSLMLKYSIGYAYEHFNK